jgi:hypothetical protein
MTDVQERPFSSAYTKRNTPVDTLIPSITNDPARRGGDYLTFSAPR